MKLTAVGCREEVVVTLTIQRMLSCVNYKYIYILYATYTYYIQQHLSLSFIFYLSVNGPADNKIGFRKVSN